MMRALIVYESMFGNTRDIALAVAQGLSDHAVVTTVEAAHAPVDLWGSFDFVVLGGPTHAFGMSRPRTRADAAHQSDDDVVTGTEVGIREWLVALRPNPDAHLRAAAFDTRIDAPRLPGSAAHRAHHLLARHGFTMICPPETFHVHGTGGPLVAGEIDRARQWGDELGRSLTRESSQANAG